MIAVHFAIRSQMPEVRTHRYVTPDSTSDHRMVICDLRHIGSVVIPGTKHVVGDGAGAY